MPRADRIRFVVYTTVFGALWGLVEMLVGTALHMARFPFRGAVLAAVGAVLLCAVRVRVDRPGAVLSAGAVAVGVKLLSIGAFRLGPLAGMMVETLLVEAVLDVLGTTALGLVLACAASCLEGVAHFFVSSRLLYGGAVFETYVQTLKGVQEFFHLPADLWKTALAAWAAAHLLIGLVAGGFAVALSRRLRVDA